MRRQCSPVPRNHMICSEVESLITEYLEDAMPQSARADFEAHLAACPECQSRLEETRALIGVSHNLGEKLSREWRERTGGETAEQYIEKLEARILGESRATRKPYRKLIPVAVGVAIIVIAAGIWIHVQNVRRANVPLALTVDLTHRGPVRGAEQPKPAPVALRQRILDLKILMPIGSEGGDYQAAIWRDGKILVEAKAPGTLKNGITTVIVRLDCRRLSRGSYLLLIRFDHWDWEHFPTVIR